MTQFPDLFAALAEPFEQHELKYRSMVANGPKNLTYITARTAMNRLDSVLGPECWWDEYVAAENSVLCRLTIRLPDGSTLTKCDAGGYAGMADSGDDDKSGYSDAFKRAAVKFGVSRYLYRDGVPLFVQDPAPAVEPPPVEPIRPRLATVPVAAANGNGNGKAHTNGVATAPAPAPAPATNPRYGPRSHGVDGQYRDGGQPRTGKALVARIMDMQKQDQRARGLFGYICGWGKSQGYPVRVLDWDFDMIKVAEGEINRYLDGA